MSYPLDDKPVVAFSPAVTESLVVARGRNALFPLIYLHLLESQRLTAGGHDHGLLFRETVVGANPRNRTGTMSRRVLSSLRLPISPGSQIASLTAGRSGVSYFPPFDTLSAV